MFHSKIRKTVAMILTVSLTLNLFFWQNMGLRASATITPGMITFSTATDGTDQKNIGQSLFDGGTTTPDGISYSNDIPGIQLDIYNANSLTGAATGSFLFCKAGNLGMTNDGIVPLDLTSGTMMSPSGEPPKYLVLKSHDGTAFSFQSIYVCDYQSFFMGPHPSSSLPYEQTLIFEGFLNGNSTGTIARSLTENSDDYTKFESTFSFSENANFQNVDEVVITNSIATYGNWAAFNNIKIGNPISYTIDAISDRTMTEKTVGYASGTQENKTITINKTGTADLKNLKVALSGGSASNFSITQPTDTTLDSTKISTSFNVKAKDNLAAGTYTDTVFVLADNMQSVTFKVTQVVNKNAGSITITGDPSKTYDGNPVSDPAFTRSGTGAVAYTYYIDNNNSIGTQRSGAPRAAGTYWVKASLAADDTYGAAEATKQFKISPISLTGSVSISGLNIIGGVMSANASVLPLDATYSYQWKLDGTVITGATGSSYSIQDSDYGKTLTAEVAGNGNYTGTISSNGVKVEDKQAPTGSITIKSNTWNSFLNTITFNLFFKDTATATITSSDTGGSGLKSVQYYKSSSALSLDEVKALTSWSDCGNSGAYSFSISPVDAEQAVFYIKITDNAGNVSYISSDGMVGDTQAPTITTNYTKGASSMEVTVIDSGSGMHSAGYTVDGGSAQTPTIDANGKFTISSLPQGKYNVVISAADKLGNISYLTVNVVSLHNVTYKLYDGDAGAALKTETVEYGNSTTPPSDDPTRIGFIFAGWDRNLDNITADTIINAKWNIGGINVTPHTGTYDGTVNDAVTVTGTLPGDTITYSTDGTNFTSVCPQVTNAGSYPVYVKVERTGYMTWESGKLTAMINKQAGSITITGDPSKTYDGNSVSDPAVTKNGTGAVTYTYYSTASDNTIGSQLGFVPRVAGAYWVKASIAEDVNHSAAEATKQFTISQASLTGDVSISGSALTGNIVTANASVMTLDATYSYQWKLDDTVITGATGSSYSIQDSDYGKTLTAEVVATGNYTGTISKSVKIGEEKAPTGSIQIDSNAWNSFLNTITFGMFFKDTKIVTVNSSDTGGSGVQSVQYYKSSSALSLDEVKALTGWNNYTAPFTITPVDAEKSVIYVKITDVAGNYSYISSDGMVCDTQGPTITTNYTKGAFSMEVTVTDSGSGMHSARYTVDGGSAQTPTIDANGKFTISSLPQGKYDVVISAVDNIGNISYHTVNVASLYNVTYKLYDGDTGDALKTETVEYGSSTIPPSDDPTRTGFQFIGWDRSLGNITADTIINAKWNIGGVMFGCYGDIYDGTAKDAAIVTGTLPGDTITYSTNGTDFTSVCPKVTNAGSYPVYVKVERTGYTTWESGLRMARVIKKAITSDMISNIASVEYTGNAFTPQPVVKDGSITLQSGTDYTVSYADNTNAGLAAVNISGQGNYTGTVAKNFAIYAKNADVEISGQQTPTVAVNGLQNLYQDTTVYTAQDKQIEQSGGSVKIQLSVQRDTNPTANAEKIQQIATGKTIGLYLDLSLCKVVTPSGQATGTSTLLSHLNDLLTIIVPIPDDLKGKSGLAVYRVHNDVASVIPTGKENAVDGEYCTIDSDTITMYLKNFSTYAVGYNAPASTSSNNQGTASNTNTGDNIWLYLILGLTAVTAGLVVVLLKRKIKR